MKPFISAIIPATVRIKTGITIRPTSAHLQLKAAAIPYATTRELIIPSTNLDIEPHKELIFSQSELSLTERTLGLFSDGSKYSISYDRSFLKVCLQMLEVRLAPRSNQRAVDHRPYSR